MENNKMSSLTVPRIFPIMRSAIPQAEESKRDKFVRLANKRLANTVDSIRLLENLLYNKAAYQFDNKDIELIIGSIVDAANQLSAYRKPNFEININNN